MNTTATVSQINTTSTAQNVDYSLMPDGHVLRVPLADIKEFHLKNVRRKRDPKKFSELKADILRHGVINGITVRPDPDDQSKVEILAGYGRWEASSELGMPNIPATIKHVADKEALAIGLSENINREDLSFLDEAMAAQRYVSLNDGDVPEAAKALGWTENKVKARLMIMSCAPEVLSALDEGKIKLGHAEVLSQFTHKLQTGTLTKIIEEKWSVETLKGRAGKAQRLLKSAKFEITDCQSCKHNSDIQSSLFDAHTGQGKCGNLVCFKERTDKWLNDVRKPELEAQYGTVLIAISKPASDRNTVSVKAVGQDQYTSGCKSCDRNACILQDGINNDCGTIIVDQCIDTDCFRKVSKAHKDAIAKATKARTASAANNSNQPAKATTSDGGKKVVEQKTPKAVTEDYRSQLRQTGAKHLLTNGGFKLGVMLASICSVSGYKPKLEGLEKNQRFNDMIHACMNEDLKSIQAEINNAVAYLASEAIDNTNITGEYTNLMIRCLSSLEEAKDKVIESWKPTKESLKMLTKQGLTALCQQSCFDIAFDITHGSGAFAKLASKSKDDFVDAVLEYDFDWSGFAPSEMLTMLK